MQKENIISIGLLAIAVGGYIYYKKNKKDPYNPSNLNLLNQNINANVLPTPAYSTPQVTLDSIPKTKQTKTNQPYTPPYTPPILSNPTTPTFSLKNLSKRKGFTF
jgi:hypothetical protein